MSPRDLHGPLFATLLLSTTALLGGCAPSSDSGDVEALDADQDASEEVGQTGEELKVCFTAPLQYVSPPNTCILGKSSVGFENGYQDEGGLCHVCPAGTDLIFSSDYGDVCCPPGAHSWGACSDPVVSSPVCPSGAFKWNGSCYQKCPGATVQVGGFCTCPPGD